MTKYDKLLQHPLLVSIPSHSLCACVGLEKKHMHGTYSQEPMLHILWFWKWWTGDAEFKVWRKDLPLSSAWMCNSETVLQSRVELEYALILEYCLLQVQTVKLCIIIKIFIDSLCKILLYLTILTCKMKDTTKYRTFS